jgi:hypothetical protein
MSLGKVGGFPRLWCFSPVFGAKHHKKISFSPFQIWEGAAFANGNVAV